MLLNLSKQFRFTNDEVEYLIDYSFSKEAGDKRPSGSGLCLTLDIASGQQSRRHTLIKPANVLYQSNEVIEKMIAEETVGLLATAG